MGGVAHNRHVADGDAIGIAAAGQQDRQCVLIHAHRLVGMHAPFLLNNAPFLLDGAVVKVEFEGQVLEHQQNRIEQLYTSRGYIGNLEAGVVKSRRGIDVATIGHPIVLKHIDHGDARKVAGALKGDMLDEVCQASFIIFLDKRSCVLHKPELGSPLGLLVVADVIGHAVLQPPCPQLGINRQLLLPAPCRWHSQQGDNSK